MFNFCKTNTKLPQCALQKGSKRPWDPFEVFSFPLFQFPVRVLSNSTKISRHVKHLKNLRAKIQILYLLWRRSFPPARLDCRHAKTALTKCKKSAPKGRPTSGHRENISWVTRRSPPPFFLRWSWKVSKISMSTKVPDLDIIIWASFMHTIKLSHWYKSIKNVHKFS